MLQTGCGMAGATRHLAERGGRYWAGLVVPKRLATIVGKSEVQIALGPDKRAALRAPPATVTGLQGQLVDAEHTRRSYRGCSFLCAPHRQIVRRTARRAEPFMLRVRNSRPPPSARWTPERRCRRKSQHPYGNNAKRDDCKRRQIAMPSCDDNELGS